MINILMIAQHSPGAIHAGKQAPNKDYSRGLLNLHGCRASDLPPLPAPLHAASVPDPHSGDRLRTPKVWPLGEHSSGVNRLGHRTTPHPEPTACALCATKHRTPHSPPTSGSFASRLAWVTRACLDCCGLAGVLHGAGHTARERRRGSPAGS